MRKKRFLNFSSADKFVKITGLLHTESETVKKSLACLFVLLSFSGLANSRTAYVTDNVEVPLRSGESERSKIVKMLANGAPLSVFQEDPELGYSYVQTSNGAEGFLLTRYISNEPSGRSQLEAANKKYAPIYPEEELKISAVVKAVIRKY